MKPAKGPMPAQPWTIEEEIALAEGWIELSENGVSGTSKKRGSFWQQVLDYFHNKMRKGEYRTIHQLNSKWADLRRKVGNFSDILNNLTTQQQSGESEADIIKAAHQQYRAQMKSSFGHEHVLDIVKKSSKWAVVPPVNPSKKSKTSESNTCTTSSNAQGLLNPDNEDGDLLEEPQRLAGSRKSKRDASSLSMFIPDDSSASAEEYFGRLMENLQDFKAINVDKKERKEQYRKELLEIKKERNRLQQEQLRLQQEQQRKKDLRTLLKPHDHLTGTDLQLVLQLKDEIRKTYGLD